MSLPFLGAGLTNDKAEDTTRDPRLKPISIDEGEEEEYFDPRKDPDLKPVYLESEKEKLGIDAQTQSRSEETMPEYLARQATRTAVTGASAFLGVPGDILKLPSIFGEMVKENLLDEKGKKLYEAFTRGGIFDPKLAEYIPGSNEILEGSKAIASYLGAKEGFLDAQTEGEKISDETISDFAALLFPVGGFARPAVRGVQILADTMAARVGRTLASNRAVLRAGGIAGGSQAVKQIAKNTFGLDEATADNWKLGTSFFLTLLTQGRGARRLGNDIRTRAEAMIPAGEVYNNAGQFRQRLLQLRAQLTRGNVTRPSEQDTVALLDQILAGMGDGEVTPQAIIRYIDLINEVRFAKNVNGQLIRRSAADRRNVNRLFDITNDAITDYGRTQNPDFLDMFSGAQGALAAEAQGAQLAENLTKSGVKDLDPGVKAMLGYIGGGGFGALSMVGAKISGEGFRIGLQKSIKALVEMSRSPVLREYFLKVIDASAKDQAPAFSKAKQQLNREYKKKKKEFEKKVPKLQPEK
jgi:hypothetical protein